MCRPDDRQRALLDRLPGYDYDPTAAAAGADDSDSLYPDDSVSQLDYGDATDREGVCLCSPLCTDTLYSLS